MQEDERTVLTGEVQQSIGKNDLSVVRFLQKPKFLRVRRLHPFEGIGPDKEPATVVTEIVFGPTPPGGDKPSPIASSKFFPLRCRNPTSVLVFHHLAGIVEQPIRSDSNVESISEFVVLPDAEFLEFPQCWGPSKKKHFGQANLKRGQVN